MDSTSTPNIQTPTESTNSPHFSLLRQPSPLKFHQQSPPPTPMDPPAEEPSSLWDFSDLLDFSLDDHLLLPFTSPPNDNENSPPSPDPPPVSDRVRKRDPRLTCSNFLAGRIPCACPEMDAQLLEEEKLQLSKKRARVSRAQSTIVKCQVPSCLADISELKGYHKRHRVCLRCANASTVVLHGDTKRYCQQCGKFHLLSDFDEGKRSCRRKLERHNNRRRRRKPALVDQEPTQNDGADCEDFGQMVEKETLVETDDGLVSNLNSTPTSINPNNSDSGPASGDTNVDGGKDDSKFSLSPSYCDDKSAYSSMCPTGRISFKLYDWNPAEFPRRLRHQIFQWLASMPVELEGYIRPGCTILTAFIAMPKFMWQKLLKDPELYVHEFVVVPGKMLSRKGRIRIYLNDLIFHVLSDGNSVMRFNMEMMTPKLHYVHPICFEAGKPIQLVACGSNLLQPNFRFLVSFAGKYLAHDYCVTFPCNESKGGSSHDHQLCKIFIPHSEPNVFGPAFIEVENASGVSNVIPVLIGDKEVCSEMEIILQRLTASHRTDSQCMIVASRQLSVLEFVVDVAWLLREPSFEYLQQIKSSTQIQRFNHLLNFLLHHESTAILTKVVENLKIIMDKMEITSNGITGSLDGDRLLLNKHMDHANSIICQKLKKRERLKLQTDDTEQERSCSPPNYCESEKPSVSPSSSENVEIISNGKSGIVKSWASIERSDIVPLLDKEVVMNVNLARGRSSKSCNQMFPNKFLKSRSTMFVVVIVTVCFGVCAVILHPNKVSRLAVSIRRCLTDGLV